ncbi:MULTISPECIES: helicase-exonuclease AddAB subunit AddA [Aeribacillus]|uniref:helicase-exonuclease AddAB subunit AddA n=1 Tax=Aeribacillus TaxID=1055323 RepID=UPI000E3879C6|nr:helicase-exonuclease AddAB subunit AddA [Aeribacillus composti]REJ25677.1 MAG: helicase-exonuclease AddAB subunit AddA [Bacillaceae bacterium]
MKNELKKLEKGQWTDEQWKAIVADGQDILVAAAAGSGKTAVLVERIIRKLTDNQHPVDVDRLLIVTFTNAAAAEMRSRIGEALAKALRNQPSSLHLRRQLTLLNKAQISTLHSFCLQVVRKFYYKIDIDPGFRIADETEMELLMEDCMDELLEEEYGMEHNELFFELVDKYTGDRSDDEIKKIIRSIYEFARSNPFPEKWLDEMVQMYDIEQAESYEDLPFFQYLRKDIAIQLSGIKDLLARALDITKLPGGPSPRAENLLDDMKQVENIINASSWQELAEQMRAFQPTRAKACRGEEYRKELIDEVTEMRKKATKEIEKLKNELFSRDIQNQLLDLKKMKRTMICLADLVKKFAVRLEAMKKEKGIVDFSDLEHYCLQILTEKDEKGNVVPSDAALFFKRQFQEVLVDEYQDTNLVQEAILKLVSKDHESEGNLFMVGDVKQSIYRFRLAEPLLFLAKYKRFTSSGTNSGLRIDLAKNFRSRKEVLDATNFLFKQLMGETVGEVVYDEAAELKLGARYPENSRMNTELLLIDRRKEELAEKEEIMIEFDEEELETVQLEARLMAKKIKELIQEGFPVYDRKLDRTRPVTYRDIVILLRSMPWAPQIMEEFKQQGIPVYANLSTGYFEATEVAIMLSLLKIIDNPYQDIPLASVLRSPIVGLSGNELAIIRLYKKNGAYFDALESFLQQEKAHHSELYQKVSEFVSRLNQWRNLARKSSVSNLIWQLYRDTRFFDFAGGMPGGKQRQANLRALYDRARQYEETSFRGLFRFLRFIERMQERGDDLGAARALGEQEDVVRIMTIHSSKGLEFPIVFCAGLSKRFNMKDLTKKYLLDKELGFASLFIDEKKRIVYPTLPYIAVKKKLRMEMLSEELRVLYVALTRAKEKLFLIGTVKDGEKKFKEWEQSFTHREWLLPDYDRLKAVCYLDWIGPAVIRHKDAAILREEEREAADEIFSYPVKLQIDVIPEEKLKEQNEQAAVMMDEKMDALRNFVPVQSTSSFANQVQSQLSWSYPFSDAASLRSKQSVTEIKRRLQFSDEYSDISIKKKIQGNSSYKRPKFMQAKSLTAAEKGTAMHTVMQHLPLGEDLTEQTIRQTVHSLVKKEILTEEQVEAVNVEGIVQFFESPLGRRLKGAKKIFREIPFNLAVPANEIYEKGSSLNTETVIVQGVIDCLFEDDDGLVLLDYKTDAVKDRFPSIEKAKQVLASRYEIQIDLYAKAVESILKRRVDDRYLFFFDAGLIIKL